MGYSNKYLKLTLGSMTESSNSVWEAQVYKNVSVKDMMYV